MGKTFQKVHGCSIGSFEGNGDKIPQWIRANGGSYSKDMNSEVTHLITTKEAYKKYVGAGKLLLESYHELEDRLLTFIAGQYARRSD